MRRSTACPTRRSRRAPKASRRYWRATAEGGARSTDRRAECVANRQLPLCLGGERRPAGLLAADRAAHDAHGLEREAPVRIGIENVRRGPGVPVLLAVALSDVVLHGEAVVARAQRAAPEALREQRERRLEWPVERQRLRRDGGNALQPL